MKKYGDEAKSRFSLALHSVLLFLDLVVQVVTYWVIYKSHSNRENNDVALTICWGFWALLDGINQIFMLGVVGELNKFYK